MSYSNQKTYQVFIFDAFNSQDEYLYKAVDVDKFTINELLEDKTL